MLIVLLLMNLMVDDSLKGVKCYFQAVHLNWANRTSTANPIQLKELPMNLTLNPVFITNLKQAMKLLQTTPRFELPEIPPTGDVFEGLNH